jgi:hypothetical protein
VSLSRMMVGTNWFLGYSHCTSARDALIKERFADYKAIADVMEVFFNAGVDTVMGPFQGAMFKGCEILNDAVQETENRTGVQGIKVSTPLFPLGPETPSRGFDMDEVRRILDAEVELGVTFTMPHTCTTDAMLDRCTREIRQFEPLCAAIRERGLHPGLSTHFPESIIYADESGLDVDTYISIFNAMGFLMPIEVDWVHNVIKIAQKPVMTIKPMAAGQLRPLQALTFVWNAIRDRDLVTVGTLSAREASELVDISRDILERRPVDVELQETRSKKAVKPLDPLTP